ncbi:ATP-binding protein [Halostella pelagica]|uniref:ATP-binding protein n=1 Tax=Halostella pelagica TaxID=2583824 RepID=UPI00108044B9|nr:ATP-binding protein [Halostella pelagica]
MSYETTQQHLLDEIDRIETLLRAYADEADTPGLSETGSDGGAGMHESAPEQLPIGVSESGHGELETHTAAIEQRCRETPEEIPLRLRELAHRFSLSRRHLDVLVLALAPDVDDSFADTLKSIQGNVALPRPTVGLVEDLFSQTRQQRVAAGALVGSDSPLRQHDLVSVAPAPDGTGTARDRTVRVDERIAEYLKGYAGIDTDLQAVLEQQSGDGANDSLSVRTTEASLSDLAISDDCHERLSSLPEDDGGWRFYWYGPAGTEKHRAVEAVCDEGVLRADLDAVIEARALDRLRREATILDRPLHLMSAAQATFDARERDTTLESVFDRFAGFGNDLIVTGEGEWTPSEAMHTPVDAIVEFPRPSIDLRREFWAGHADELPDDIDPEVLAGTFNLTPGQLAAALSTAESLSGDGELTAQAVYAGCSAQSADELDELAQKIEPGKDWDDIVLREETRRKLELVRNHVRHQARIYGDWGFSEQFSRGTGVVALFKGESGTGKTMAAEILANDVGMDIYKIDLSSVVSKYIGETEENLEQIFQAAENSNAILLFDEADAVFGDRSKVSDSTDRYANVEVNYLLQRIEAYDGVILLTTNYASNIDSAFNRRIDHEIEFKSPRESTRETIWKNIFPDDAPTGDVDYEFLSEFTFTGGRIKTVGQTAAILAAGNDSEAIEMSHAVRAVQLELEKIGRLYQVSEFEPYEDYLVTD